MEQQCEVNEIKEIREANATNSIEEWLQLLQDAEAEQDGSQEEDNGNPGGRGGGYGGGRKDRKPKTTRKEAFAGLPRQNVYELDVDELNRMYGEGNWRIAN